MKQCLPVQFDVLEPLLDELLAIEPQNNEDIDTIRKLLETIPRFGPLEIAKQIADRDTSTTVEGNAQETAVSFQLRGYKVLLIQAVDLDVSKPKVYTKTSRAKRSAAETKHILTEGKMPLATQQYLMAQILRERSHGFTERAHQANEKRLSSGPIKDPRTANKSVFAELRALARERYWVDMTGDDRAQVRQIAEAVAAHPLLDAGLKDPLQKIKDNWSEKWWKNDHNDPDYFENFVRDQACAESVWVLKKEDVVVVVD